MVVSADDKEQIRKKTSSKRTKERQRLKNKEVTDFIIKHWNKELSEAYIRKRKYYQNQISYLNGVIEGMKNDMRVMDHYHGQEELEMWKRLQSRCKHYLHRSTDNGNRCSNCRVEFDR